jgi:hypothetical protein
MKLFLSTICAVSALFALIIPSRMGAQSNIQLAKLWTVHIDEVLPQSIAEFERVGSTQAQLRDSILRAHKLPVSSSYSFNSADGKYFSLRPRTSYGELDQPLKLPDAVRKIFRELVNPYSDTAHSTLRDHHNEIWMWDSSSSYFPATFVPTIQELRYVHIRSEWVKPPMNVVYDSVMTRFREALVKERYPLTCIAFFSSYGSGANHYLWHARRSIDLVNASTPEQILIIAYGEQEGKALARTWNDCLFKTEDTDAMINPDDTNLGRDLPWLGIILH